MKNQSNIYQDEIKSQRGKVHDPSTTDSNPLFPKNDSHFQGQMHLDLRWDKPIDAGLPLKDDLEYFKMKNADRNNEIDQEGDTKKKDKQKTRTPRYPFRSYGIRSMKNGIWTFEDLRKELGFIDKTKFILDFHYEFGEATCILRPRRSGKTLTIKMLKEFYWVPEIDVMSYNPDTKEHANMNYTVKDVFKGTFVYDRNNRKEYCKKYEKSEKDTFIEDNMNKWPVIRFYLGSVNLCVNNPEQKEINWRFFENAIRRAFKEYDYVIFLRLAEEVWKIKYGTFSNETYQKLLRDFNFRWRESIQDKIRALWHSFKKELPAWIKEFLRTFYNGETSYEDIETPLKTVIKIISEFYNKPVIILVDGHDSPIQGLFWNIMDNQEGYKKAPELIRRISNTINSMFKAVGKGNQYVKKLLLFGILNNVVNYNNSDFDNLKIVNVYEQKYSEYFGMTQTEVDGVIDKLFPVKKEIKDKIRAKVNMWYNGYYHKQGSPLYSIVSTSLYISKCFEAYTKQYTESKDFQDYWIPEPEPFWADFGHFFFVNNYLNFGFGGKHGHFLRDLSLDCPAYYPGCDPEYVPQFENTTDPEESVKILFHSMMHGGYLTQFNGDKKLFRIPSFELKRLLLKKLNPYLESFIHDDYIGDIFSEIKKENIEELGKKITELLRHAFISQKYKKNYYGFPPPEVLIYKLLLKILDILPKSRDYNVAHEHGARTPSSQNAPEEVQTENFIRKFGFKVDFHLIERRTDTKTHYVIESKADRNNTKGMKSIALEGLSQIFLEDNHLHISPLPETHAIVNIGLSFEANRVCLIALKVHVDGGKYVKVDPLMHLEFKADETYEDEIKVDLTKQEEFDIQLPEISKESNSNPTDNDSLDEHNRKARDYILNRIGELKMSDNEANMQNHSKKDGQSKQ
jgi:hypothetical protein